MRLKKQSTKKADLVWPLITSCTLVLGQQCIINVIKIASDGIKANAKKLAKTCNDLFFLLTKPTSILIHYNVIDVLKCTSRPGLQQGTCTKVSFSLSSAIYKPKVRGILLVPIECVYVGSKSKPQSREKQTMFGRASRYNTLKVHPMELKESFERT